MVRRCPLYETYEITMLKLEFPNISHKTEFLSMIEEWRAFEAIPTSPDTIFYGNTYEEFLERVNSELHNPPQGYVPASLFFIMDWERILGAIHIRHNINTPFLTQIWWHIGYGIRPSERNKWYATEWLRLWLLEAKELWINKVMIGCYDDNIGSYRTIEKNNGKFERYEEYNNKKARIYMIDL